MPLRPLRRAAARSRRQGRDLRADGAADTQGHRRAARSRASITPGTVLDEETLAPDRATISRPWSSRAASLRAGGARFLDRRDPRDRDASPMDASTRSCARRGAEPKSCCPRDAAEARCADAIRPAAAALRTAATHAPPARRAQPRLSPGTAAAAGAGSRAARARRALVLLVTTSSATQGGNIAHLRAPEFYDAALATCVLDAPRGAISSCSRRYDGSARGALRVGTRPLGHRHGQAPCCALAAAPAVRPRRDRTAPRCDRGPGRATSRCAPICASACGASATSSAWSAASARQRFAARPGEARRRAVVDRGAARNARRLAGDRHLAAARDAIEDAAGCSRALIAARLSSTSRRCRSARGRLIREGFDAEVDRLRAISPRRQGMDRSRSRPPSGDAPASPIAQGRVQPGLRLLHRGHQRIRPRGSGRLRAQADRRQRRALRHAGAQSDARARSLGAEERLDRAREAHFRGAAGRRRAHSPAVAWAAPRRRWRRSTRWPASPRPRTSAATCAPRLHDGGPLEIRDGTPSRGRGSILGSSASCRTTVRLGGEQPHA